ncbi:MAG: GAF domain-containing SpoIIE family protein phosphatase [Chloroflexota bacterium]
MAKRNEPATGFPSKAVKSLFQESASDHLYPWAMRLYSYLFGLLGLTILAANTVGLSLGWALWPASLFLIVSFLVKRFGFRVTPGGTHSLVGIADVAAICVFGPAVGGGVAALGAFLHAESVALERRRFSSRTLLEVPIFDSGLKGLMGLSSGWAYLALGGQLGFSTLSLGLVPPLAGLYIAWFLLDHAGWGVMELLRGGPGWLLGWLKAIIGPSLLVEFLPLPLSVILVSAYSGLGLAMFVLTAVALVLTSLVVRLFAETAVKLRTRVAELTGLNEFGQALVRAQLDTEQLCELIYAEVSRIMDTSYFDLGLFNGDDYVLKLWVENRVRQPALSLPTPVGKGMIGWVRQTRQPLLVRDFQKEQDTLPAQPRWVGDTSVRSALYVPLVAGQNVIGAISIFSREPGSYGEDHLRLLGNIANQVAIVLENARLYQETLEKERIANELRLAHDIQASLLPETCPEVPGWQICADWRSMWEVSGDFYDFIDLPGKSLGLLIADVSDKGVPAALFMALSRSLIRANVTAGLSPSEALARANRWVLKDTKSGQFVTLFYGILSLHSGELHYVLAGHNPPLVYRERTGQVEALEGKGIALGIIEDVVLEERRVRLKPGDVLVLYTDGVTEAWNNWDECFGRERLTQVLRDHHSLAAGDLIQRINDAVAAFVSGAPQSDDATLVVVKRE